MIDTDFILKVCKAAGDAIMEIYESDDFEIESKDDLSPITKADIIANKIISDELFSKYPNIPIISEESMNESFDVRKHWHSCFIVDPIDGTKEFIKKNGEFTVNIAYVESGYPIEGFIYAPAKETFYFTKNATSYKKDKLGVLELPVKETTNFTFVTSRSHLDNETQNYIKQLQKNYPNMDTLAVGSSLKFCMIAEGSANEYTRFSSIMEWDTAAAQVIVENSGGRFIDIESNNRPIYNKKTLKTNAFKVIGI